MRVKRLIKHFVFEEGNRSKVVLGSGTRLNPETNRLMLSEPYSTAANLQAKTWVWAPESVKQWLGFEAVVTHGYADGRVQETSLGFRLGDGTNEHWWNGAAWVVNTTDWNTEEEVAANIPSFPVAERKLQVVINLKTDDDAYSPMVREIKVLWGSDIEWQEDLIFRSVVRDLKAKIRPIADYLIQLPSATDTIDLKNDFPLESSYNIVDMDSAFDHSNDSHHLSDLLASYDPVNQVVTLSSSLPAGTLVWLRFVYEPEVSVTTSEDYSEVARLPSVVLDDINLVEGSELGQDDWVVNKGTNEAVKLPPPFQGDLEVVVNVLTDKAIDQQRLADEFKRYFSNNPLLRSRGLDEEYSLWLIDEYDSRTPSGAADLHTGQLRFRIRDIVVYGRDAVDRFGVKRFRLTGDMDLTIE